MTGPERSESAGRGVLVAVALGTILAPLNSTMIAVAVSPIARDLGASTATVGWLVTSYLIVIGAMQPFAGRLGDRLGRRRLFLIGLAGFGLASVGAALAPSFAVLVLCRVLQSLAGALSFPNGAALVRFAVPAERRARAFGVVWGAASAAAAVGPTLGGVIVDGAGWRAMFYANVPVALVAVILGARVIPRREPLVREARAPGAMVGLFRNRVFAAANCGIALSNLSMYAVLLASPILLIDGYGWSPAQAGLALTALSAPSAILAPIGGRLADRYGRRLPTMVGFAVVTAGLVPLAAGADSPVPLIVSLVIAGIGFGLSFASLQTAAIEAVAAADAGMASGLFSTSRYAGGIVGSVALGAILTPSPSGVDGFQGVAVLIAVTAALATVASVGLRGVGRRETLAAEQVGS